MAQLMKLLKSLSLLGLATTTRALSCHSKGVAGERVAEGGVAGKCLAEGGGVAEQSWRGEVAAQQP